MPTLSRRTFLASLASALPVAIIVRRAHAASVLHLTSDPATLDALAEAVLPPSLGRAGIAAEVKAFRDWGAGYREGAETVHGYGTSRLRSLGPTPLTKWASQLDDLDARAQARHQRNFRDLPVSERTDLVRTVLQGQRFDRLPSVTEATHVSVALLAHFYESSAANDLCYEAKIGRQTCRPLSTSSGKPLPMIKVRER